MLADFTLFEILSECLSIQLSTKIIERVVLIDQSAYTKMRLWVLVTTTGPPHAGRTEARGLGSLPLPDTFLGSTNSLDTWNGDKQLCDGRLSRSMSVEN